MSRRSGDRALRRFATMVALMLAVVAGGVVMRPAAVFARPMQDTEKASLATVVADYTAAMQAGDYARVVQTVPEKIIDSIAARNKIPADTVRDSMVELFAKALKSITLDSYAMDLPAAIYKERPDGTPYALIPTETVMTIPARGQLKVREHTLAMQDDGKWYLVRVSEPKQVLVLREAYPEFAGIEFPQGSTEVLK